MNKQSRKNSLILILFAVLFTLIILYVDVQSYHLPVFIGTTDSETVWLFSEKGKEGRPADFSASYRFEPGKTYLLSTVLTYDGKNDDYPCVFVTTGNFEVNAYLGQELVSHYTKKDRGFPKLQSVGSCCFSIPLEHDCTGREIRIEISSPFTDYAVNRKLPLIRIGDYSSILHRMFYQNLPGMLVSLAIIFNVIILVVLSNLHDRKSWSYIYFALFSVLLVLFRGTQDLFVVYLLGSPYMVVFWEHISITACLIPLLLSYRNKFYPFYKKTFNWLTVIATVNLALQFLLNSLGIMDLVLTARITHVLLVINAVAIYILGILIKKKTGIRHIFSTVLPILIGCIMDVISFYLHHFLPGEAGFFSLGNFTGLGLLISLMLMILETRRERISNYRKIERNRLLEKMAYTDALTGILNRAAFDKDLKIMSDSKDLEQQSVLCVSADINGLKKVNDTVGHHAGDELICRAATLLNEHFRDYGNVYRIGGDEFFAFLYGVSEEKWNDIMERMKQSLQEENRDYDNALSVAIGAIRLNSPDIGQTIQSADRIMYEDKQKYHAAQN